MRWAILDAVPGEQARAVLAVARRRKVGKGGAVFSEGDHGDCLYLLERGRIAVRVTTPMGNVATLRILAPGDAFGELAIISPGRRSATALALDDVVVLTVHRDQMEALRAKNPDVDRVLIEVLTAEVRHLSQLLVQARYTPLPQRLASCLLDLADVYGSAIGPVDIPLTQEDLAGLCGTTRPSANQILKQLEAQGTVTVARGRVVVRDRDALRRLAGPTSAG